ncbi:MAG: chemotaxis protein CheD [Bacillota bacterium]
MIGIAELAVSRAPDTLTTLGLGSCVGVALYDAAHRIGGLAHIMLPCAPSACPTEYHAKYADTAIHELLQRLMLLGADLRSLTAKLAGGAHMFASLGKSDYLQIGQKNLLACYELLAEHSIAVVAEETGGTVGRTVVFDCQSGQMLVRTAMPKAEFII